MNRTPNLDVLYSVAILEGESVTFDFSMNLSGRPGHGPHGKYVLYATTAPRAYDYVVIEVMVQDDVRWVLIPEERVEGQTMRYASGLYPAVRSIDPTSDGILSVLWHRLHSNVQEGK